jgi:hypothetical protein
MKPHDEKLMRLHDDELPAAEAEALRQALSAEDREKLLALKETGEAVAGALLGAAEPVDLWAGIERRLPEARVRPRRTLQITAAVTALAMAAALLIWLRPEARDSEVESLEIAGAVATVFEIPDDQGETATVLWMEHQESDEWESL